MEQSVEADELERWFAEMKAVLEPAYLSGEQPWQQSGVGLHSPHAFANWQARRKVIADIVDRSGSFLDIGCANGFLLECVMQWVAKRGLSIVPFGLDLSAPLVARARERLPECSGNLFVGNAWDWEPPQRFDFVRTELVYVPDELQPDYLTRLLERFLLPSGCLLVAEYRARGATTPNLTIDETMRAFGFPVDTVATGIDGGVEQARVAVIRNA
jgi:SAM-dependent methyltransferase